MQTRDVWLLMAGGAFIAVIGLAGSTPALAWIGGVVAVIGFAVWQVTARRSPRHHD